MKSFDRPLIGITCPGDRSLLKSSDLYSLSVEKAGGRSIFVSSGSSVPDLIRDLEGLIVPGGRDPEPALYGERRLYDIDPEETERTEFEFSLLHGIMRRRRSILGICYGMQVINIFLGGSLFQDIPSQIAGSLNHREGGHVVRIEENPFLAKGLFEVTSNHHQAVKEGGKGVRPFAFAPDGVVEAYYVRDYRFFVGVQWHPERMDVALSGQLFKQFVEACRA